MGCKHPPKPTTPSPGPAKAAPPDRFFRGDRQGPAARQLAHPVREGGGPSSRHPQLPPREPYRRRHLPAGANADGWRYADFDAVAERHCDRQGPPEDGPRERCADYRCFWSLNFALHRDDWARSGGFDEGYTGYGGEDTDFGRTLDERGVPIWWIRGARVYHQHHAHAMPPVHHVASVLRNTDRFAEKWGHRTMEHWLYAFEEMGLIVDGPRGLEQVREPDEADYALCRQQSDQPYASTNRVLKLLEERKAGRALSQREANETVRANQRALLRPRHATAADLAA